MYSKIQVAKTRRLMSMSRKVSAGMDTLNAPEEINHVIDELGFLCEA
jgi:hypothetical protein